MEEKNTCLSGCLLNCCFFKTGHHFGPSKSHISELARVLWVKDGQGISVCISIYLYNIYIYINKMLLPSWLLCSNLEILPNSSESKTATDTSNA